ncbi:MAG: cyanophycinase, partial [Candidatus Cloacimonetes bacterium]|nr:cyanophycinase [Candidatus Cloacimonadota bacterium]
PASRYYPYELGDKYRDVFGQLGIERVEVIDIRYKEEAEAESHLNILDESDCVFFTGGDQVRLMEILGGTKFLDKLRLRLNAGMTVAGTSAGAAVMSNPMIFDGDEMGFLKGSVNHGDGFGIIDGITVDTHFLVRNRIPRLVQFLLRGHGNIGVGIAEDTGIIISPDMTSRVIGTGMVTIINSSKVSFTDYKTTKIDEQFTSTGFEISFLAPGAKFDFKTNRII